MSNHSNSLYVHKVKFSTRTHETTANGFEELMDFDFDFTGNEEYFRKDTLKKGFRNEAHRIAVENTKKPVKDHSDLENRVNLILGKVFDSSYYGEWEATVIPIMDDEYAVVVSYIS